MIDLSIIIVSWNAKGYLMNCLRTIEQETRDIKSEIIVVDNNSSDGSQEAVLKEFSRVKLICNNKNFGFARANNIGIKQCVGKYICFVNSDVEILEGCIRDMMDYMKRNKSIGMLGPKVLNSDSTIQHSCKGFPTLWNTLCRSLALDVLFPKWKLFCSLEMSWWSYDSIESVDVLSGCFWLVRREALEEVGFLDERFFIYAEDKDWCKRFWNLDWKVVFYPYAQVIHYGGGSSLNAPMRFYLEMQRANIQYWKKHHDKFSQTIEYIIMVLHECLRITGGLFFYLIKPSSRDITKFKLKRHLSCLNYLLGIQNIKNRKKSEP